jgi:hypothetical protein
VNILRAEKKSVGKFISFHCSANVCQAIINHLIPTHVNRGVNHAVHCLWNARDLIDANALVAIKILTKHIASHNVHLQKKILIASTPSVSNPINVNVSRDIIPYQSFSASQFAIIVLSVNVWHLICANAMMATSKMMTEFVFPFASHRALMQIVFRQMCVFVIKIMKNI